MAMRTFKELLISLDACEEARDWAGEMTIEEVVEKCHRGDWLLWLARKIEVDERKRYLAAGHCANTVRHLMDDERSTAAVDAAYAATNTIAASAASYAAGACTGDAASSASSASSAAAASALSGRANWIKTANICRKYLGQEIITKVNQML